MMISLIVAAMLVSPMTCKDGICVSSGSDAYDNFVEIKASDEVVRVYKNGKTYRMVFDKQVSYPMWDCILYKDSRNKPGRKEDLKWKK